MLNDKTIRAAAAVFVVGVSSVLPLRGAVAETAGTPPVDPASLARIRDTAMSSDWAWRHLARLTDEIGPRLSGSPQLALAVTQVADAMRSLGARVTLQPAKVPHWVRGDAQAQVVDYPGRPTGIAQRLALTALGGSAATPEKGSRRASSSCTT